MSAEKESLVLEKTGLENFSAILQAEESHKKESVKKFRQKIAECYFSYVLSSWGLSPENRKSLFCLFKMEFKQALKNFCEENDLEFETIWHDSMFNNYRKDTQLSDIFVRKLILDYKQQHSKSYYKFLVYRFPAEEHESMVHRYLRVSVEKNILTPEKANQILKEARAVRENFSKEIKMYEKEYAFEKNWIVSNFLRVVTPLLGVTLIIKLDPKEEMKPLYIIFLVILAVTLATFAILMKDIFRTHILKYGPKIGKANFTHVDDLSDQFKNFLEEEIEKIFNLLLTSKVNTASKKTPKVAFRSRNYIEFRDREEDDKGKDRDVFIEDLEKPAKNFSRVVPLKKENTSSKTEKTVGGNVSSAPVLDSIIRWKIYRKGYVESYNYNPQKISQSMIGLWNNEKGDLLKAYIYWNGTEIKKAVKNPQAYEKFFVVGHDGHVGNQKTGSQGFFPVSEHMYKLKVLGIFGDARMRFKEESEAKVIEGDPKAKLYTYHSYTPHAHN